MSRHRNYRPRRRRPLRETRRVIRVHVEGEKTEPGYLSQWERRHRETVKLSFGKWGQVPSSLVENACQDEDERRRMRRNIRPPYDYDEIWCVFDVDKHLNLKQTIARATQRRIGVVVSNPCFELWLVLHCQDQTAYIDGRQIQRLAKKLGVIEKKQIKDNDRLIDAYEDAKRRAKQLDKMHERNYSPPRSNPSTDIWRLVDSIRRSANNET